MPGELWRERLQIGKETTPGTPVPATRILYLDSGSVKFDEVHAPRFHKFATGTRDNVRAYTSGATQAGGQAKLSVSSDELLEWLLMGIAGGISPTTPSGATLARLWTFTPSTTLDAATIERDDASGNLSQLTGVRVDKIGISGAVGAENTATVDFFAQDRIDGWAGPLTPALASRTPTFLEGWQTRFWVTSYGGTVQSVLVPNALINWDVQIGNALGRKYTALNTKAASAITFGELAISAKLMLEATSASAIAEMVNWNTDTKRLITLEFLGPADEIEAGTNDVQTVTSTATSGSFKLIVAGNPTAAIAATATAAQVAAAVNALTLASSIGVVTATGGPINSTPVVLTFGIVGSLFEKTLVPVMTVDNALAVGGTAVVAHTTPGRSGRRSVAIDIPGAWTSPDVDSSDAGTRAYTFPFEYVYDPTLAAGIQFRVQTNRAVAYV